MNVQNMLDRLDKSKKYVIKDHSGNNFAMHYNPNIKEWVYASHYGMTKPIKAIQTYDSFVNNLKDLLSSVYDPQVKEILK